VRPADVASGGDGVPVYHSGVKIDATCDTCGRRFLLSQIGPDSDAPGRCPFCGARFARHYSTVLVDAVDDAERAAGSFVQIIGRLQSMETGFDIDIERLLRTVAEQVRAHESRQAAS
jgi:hypothetical protein